MGKDRPRRRGKTYLLPSLLFSLFLLSLCLRLPLLTQSLWYDEMISLYYYILKPGWLHIVAGNYSPNNHILFTLLAKLLLGSPDDIAVGSVTVTARLPSLLAGSLVAVALAGAFWEKDRKLSLLCGLLAAFHPWLISFSGWARGYALLVLLSVLCTHFLPTTRKRVDLRYIVLVILTLYTQPLAILLVGGHAAATWLTRREVFFTWFRSAASAGVVLLLLYLPLFKGAGKYWSAPEKPSIAYSQFVNQTFRYVQSGDNAAGIVHLLTPLLILFAGGYLAWRRSEIRPLLISFAVASLLGLVVPLLIPTAGEVRAMIWLIPLYCLCAATLILAAPNRWVAASAALLLLVVFQLRNNWIYDVPGQPIRDAIAETRSTSQGTKVVGVYMASDMASVFYGLDAIAYDVPTLQQIESKGIPTQVLVFYESFLRRDQPRLWNYLQDHYVLVKRLDGRVSPTAIYKPR